MKPRASSFDAFYNRSRSRVLGALAIVTHDVAAAEDAAQEAYLRAFRNWVKVSELEQPELWVIRVGTNAAISAWRKHRRNQEEVPEITETATKDLVESVWLEWGLAQLSVSERAAVILHHLEDQPVKEIARATQVSETSVKQRLHRARLRLRGLLAPEGGT